ncbi:MAG: phosphomannomutase/phosphoglucomutase [Limnochordaceae bacterium]|nr:phosphomannomutase/phosphoglucomutase [Limnochordaceae bacterium]
MVSIPAEIFREYDIRGLADTELTPPVMEVLGRTLAEYYRDVGDSVTLVGRDNRWSSFALRDALVRGLTAGGQQVVDLGVVTTPLFYFARIDMGIDAGLMITASHNPPQYNGLKVAHGFATIYGEQIQDLRKRAEEVAARLVQGGVSPGPAGVAGASEGRAETPGAAAATSGQVTQVDKGPDYLRMLQDKIRLGPRRLKIVVDCGNGTGSLFAVPYLKGLGCEVIPLYCESDGHFPHHQPDPTVSANMKDLAARVVAEKADAGIGFDGDADRIGVVDDQGQILWGDELMVLFWREILPRHPGTTAIVEVKCSQALVEEIQRLGGRPLWYKTGHSLIKAKMKEIGAVFTGEMSGHMFFADEYYGFDDAFYAAGRLLRILSHSSQSLSQMRTTIPHYCSTAETRVPCTEESKFHIVAGIRDTFRSRLETAERSDPGRPVEVIAVDGARVVFPDGWGLVRASNTQPVIVARCEGRSEAALHRIEALMKAELMKYPEVQPFEWAY